MKDTSPLAFALLGLLQQKPRSGYDLRKIFSNTPMGSFSDSPGAIYPALQRLEKRGFVACRVQVTSGLRRRRLFRPTAAGRAAFKAWQTRAIASDDVINHVDELMLRFSFMDETAGSVQAMRFLNALAKELVAYIPSLREFLKVQGASIPLSGRLALESGIRGYETLLGWTRSALATYRKRRKEGARR
ncbi:MAG TPA: PadR family transcriptional regulator [Candidatus Acidoferrum sp.]|nr:PadR family transcriptional regulator [Candidatus Acidoferrum sp.]